MKVKRAFCEDCNEYRPFQYEAPCSGLESCVWFLLGLFFHWALWIVLVWRNLSFSRKYTCQACGSSNYSEPKNDTPSAKSGV